MTRMNPGTWTLALTSGLAATIATLVTIVFPAPPGTVIMASGLPGSATNFYARRYKERLAASGVALELVDTNGGVDGLKMITDATSGVQIALVASGLLPAKPPADIVSLGSAYNVGIWIFARDMDSVDTLAQFKGKRISVGPEGSASREIATRILAQFGVTPATATFLPIPAKDAYAAWVRREIDVAWAVGAPSGDLIPPLLKDASARIVSFPMADAFVQLNPHFVKLNLRRGVVGFEQVIPNRDATMLGTEAKVLVRKDLHPEIVTLLLQTMAAEHSGATALQKSGEFPRATDVEFPMADNALAFYKNGPSYFQRYLPLWLTPYVQRSIAFLVALMAVLLPTLNYGQRGYRWLIRQRLDGGYRVLRLVDKGMQSALSLEEVARFQSDVESLDQQLTTYKIPDHHSDLLFAFKVHLNLVRTRLAARHAELKSRAHQDRV
jgi:TRAP-type uncharacterized transport system substrate-binding protein